MGADGAVRRVIGRRLGAAIGCCDGGMGNAQKVLALSIVVFVGWVVVNCAFWNVAKDLGWLPSWLALALLAGSFAIGGVVHHFFLRRWRPQFEDNTLPPAS
jgi:hypothetical protein